MAKKEPSVDSEQGSKQTRLENESTKKLNLTQSEQRFKNEVESSDNLNHEINTVASISNGPGQNSSIPKISNPEKIVRFRHFTTNKNFGLKEKSIFESSHVHPEECESDRGSNYSILEGDPYQTGQNLDYLEEIQSLNNKLFALENKYDEMIEREEEIRHGLIACLSNSKTCSELEEKRSNILSKLSGLPEEHQEIQDLQPILDAILLLSDLLIVASDLSVLNETLSRKDSGISSSNLLVNEKKLEQQASSTQKLVSDNSLLEQTLKKVVEDSQKQYQMMRDLIKGIGGKNQLSPEFEDLINQL